MADTLLIRLKSEISDLRQSLASAKRDLDLFNAILLTEGDKTKKAQVQQQRAATQQQLIINRAHLSELLQQERTASLAIVEQKRQAASQITQIEQQRAREALSTNRALSVQFQAETSKVTQQQAPKNVILDQLRIRLAGLQQSIQQEQQAIKSGNLRIIAEQDATKKAEIKIEQKAAQERIAIYRASSAQIRTEITNLGGSFGQTLGNLVSTLNQVGLGNNALTRTLTNLSGAISAVMAKSQATAQGLTSIGASAGTASASLGSMATSAGSAGAAATTAGSAATVGGASFLGLSAGAVAAGVGIGAVAIEIGSFVIGIKVAIELTQQWLTQFRSGIEAVGHFEQQVQSLAGLLVTTGQIDLGDPVRSLEGAADVVRQRVIPALRDVAIQSAGTTEQATLVFRQLTAHGVGLNQALSTTKGLLIAIISTVGHVPDLERQLTTETNALIEGQARAGAAVAKQWDAYFKTIGTSLKEQIRFFREGNAKAQPLIDLLKKYEDQGKKLGTTYAGLISTFQLLFEQTQRFVFTDAFETLRNGAIQLRDFLVENQKELEKFLLPLKQLANFTGEAIVNWARNFGRELVGRPELVQRVADAIQNVIRAVLQIATPENLIKLVETLAKLAENAANALPDLGRLASGLSSIASISLDGLTGSIQRWEQTSISAFANILLHVDRFIDEIKLKLQFLPDFLKSGLGLNLDTPTPGPSLSPLGPQRAPGFFAFGDNEDISNAPAVDDTNKPPPPGVDKGAARKAKRAAKDAADTIRRETQRIERDVRQKLSDLQDVLQEGVVSISDFELRAVVIISQGTADAIAVFKKYKAIAARDKETFQRLQEDQRDLLQGLDRQIDETFKKADQAARAIAASQARIASEDFSALLDTRLRLIQDALQAELISEETAAERTTNIRRLQLERQIEDIVAQDLALRKRAGVENLQNEETQALLEKRADLERQLRAVIAQGESDILAARQKDIEKNRQLLQSELQLLDAQERRLQVDVASGRVGIGSARQQALQLDKDRIAVINQLIEATARQIQLDNESAKIIEARLQAIQLEVAGSILRNESNDEAVSLLGKQDIALESNRGRVIQLRTELVGLIAQLKALVDASNAANSTFGKLSTIFGDLSGVLSSLPGVLGNIGGLVGNLATAFKSLSSGGGIGGAFKQITGAFSKGADGQSPGVFGGISNLIGGVASLAGPFGQIASTVLGFVSVFKTLFTAAAKKIGENARKDISEIMKNVGDNLAKGINDVQQRQAKAVADLSGKKGGAGEIKKVNEQADAALKDLQKRAGDIRKAFEESLSFAGVTPGVQSFLKDLQSAINESIKFTLAAGNFNEVIERLTLLIQAQLGVAFQGLNQDLSTGTHLIDQFFDSLRDAVTQAIAGGYDIRHAAFFSEIERLRALFKEAFELEAFKQAAKTALELADAEQQLIQSKKKLIELQHDLGLLNDKQFDQAMVKNAADELAAVQRRLQLIRETLAGDNLTAKERIDLETQLNGLLGEELNLQNFIADTAERQFQAAQKRLSVQLDLVSSLIARLRAEFDAGLLSPDEFFTEINAALARQQSIIEEQIALLQERLRTTKLISVEEKNTIKGQAGELEKQRDALQEQLTLVKKTLIDINGISQLNALQLATVSANFLTFAGRLATAFDSVGKVSNTVWDDLKTKTTEGLAALTESLKGASVSQLLDQIKNLQDSLVELKAERDKLVEDDKDKPEHTPANPAIARLNTLIGQITSSIATLSAQLGLINTDIAKSQQSLIDLLPKLSGLSAADLDKIKKRAQDIIDLANLLKKSDAELAAIDKTRAGINADIAALLEAQRQAMDGATASLTTLLTSIQSGIDAIQEALLGVLTADERAAKEKELNDLLGTRAGILRAIQQAQEEATQAFVDFFNVLGQIVPELADQLGLLGDLFKFASSFLFGPGLGNMIKAFTNLEKVVDENETSLNALFAALNELFNGIFDPKFIEDFSSGILGPIRALGDLIKNLFTGIKDPFGDPTETVNWLQDIIGFINKGSKAFNEDLLKIGDRIQRIVLGANALSDKEHGIGKAAEQAIKFSEAFKDKGPLEIIAGIVELFKQLEGIDEIFNAFAGALASALPILQLIAQVVAFLTKKAQEAADIITEKFNDAVTDIQRTATKDLTTAINQVQQAATDAIKGVDKVKKSVKKKTIEELNKQKDQLIKDLRIQAAELRDTFEETLFFLTNRLQKVSSIGVTPLFEALVPPGSDNTIKRTTTLMTGGIQSVTQALKDATDQALAYVNAGGKVASANEFISITLKNLRQDAEGRLNDFLSQAVDARQQELDIIEQIEDAEKRLRDLSQGTRVKAVESEIAGRRRQRKEILDQIDGFNKELDLAKIKREAFAGLVDENTTLNDLQAIRIGLAQTEAASIKEQLTSWRDIAGVLDTVMAKIAKGLDPLKAFNDVLKRLGLVFPALNDVNLPIGAIVPGGPLPPVVVPGAGDNDGGPNIEGLQKKKGVAGFIQRIRNIGHPNQQPTEPTPPPDATPDSVGGGPLGGIIGAIRTFITNHFGGGGGGGGTGDDDPGTTVLASIIAALQNFLGGGGDGLLGSITAILNKFFKGGEGDDAKGKSLVDLIRDHLNAFLGDGPIGTVIKQLLVQFFSSDDGEAPTLVDWLKKLIGAFFGGADNETIGALITKILNNYLGNIGASGTVLRLIIETLIAFIVGSVTGGDLPDIGAVIKQSIKIWVDRWLPPDAVEGHIVAQIIRAVVDVLLGDTPDIRTIISTVLAIILKEVDKGSIWALIIQGILDWMVANPPPPPPPPPAKALQSFSKVETKTTIEKQSIEDVDAAAKSAVDEALADVPKGSLLQFIARRAAGHLLDKAGLPPEPPSQPDQPTEPVAPTLPPPPAATEKLTFDFLALFNIQKGTLTRVLTESAAKWFLGDNPLDIIWQTLDGVFEALAPIRTQPIFKGQEPVRISLDFGELRQFEKVAREGVDVALPTKQLASLHKKAADSLRITIPQSALDELNKIKGSLPELLPKEQVTSLGETFRSIVANFLPEEEIKKLEDEAQAALTSSNPVEKLMSVWEEVKKLLAGTLPDDQVNQLRDSLKALFDTFLSPEHLQALTHEARQSIVATQDQLTALRTISAEAERVTNQPQSVRIVVDDSNIESLREELKRPIPVTLPLNAEQIRAQLQASLPELLPAEEISRLGKKLHMLLSSALPADEVRRLEESIQAALASPQPVDKLKQVWREIKAVLSGVLPEDQINQLRLALRKLVESVVSPNALQALTDTAHLSLDATERQMTALTELQAKAEKTAQTSRTITILVDNEGLKALTEQVEHPIQIKLPIHELAALKKQAADGLMVKLRPDVADELQRLNDQVLPLVRKDQLQQVRDTFEEVLGRVLDPEQLEAFQDAARTALKSDDPFDELTKAWEELKARISDTLPVEQVARLQNSLQQLFDVFVSPTELQALQTEAQRSLVATKRQLETLKTIEAFVTSESDKTHEIKISVDSSDIEQFEKEAASKAVIQLPVDKLAELKQGITDSLTIRIPEETQTALDGLKASLPGLVPTGQIHQLANALHDLLSEFLPEEQVKNLEQEIRDALNSESPIEPLMAVWNEAKKLLSGVVPEDQVERVQESLKQLFAAFITTDQLNALTQTVEKSIDSLNLQLEVFKTIEATVIAETGKARKVDITVDDSEVANFQAEAKKSIRVTLPIGQLRQLHKEAADALKVTIEPSAKKQVLGLKDDLVKALPIERLREIHDLFKKVLGDALSTEEVRNFEQSVMEAFKSDNPLDQMKAIWDELLAHLKGTIPADQLNLLHDALVSLFSALPTPESLKPLTDGMDAVVAQTQAQLDAVKKIQSAIILDVPDQNQTGLDRARTFVDGLATSVRDVAKAWNNLVASPPDFPTENTVEASTNKELEKPRRVTITVDDSDVERFVTEVKKPIPVHLPIDELKRLNRDAAERLVVKISPTAKDDIKKLGDKLPRIFSKDQLSAFRVAFRDVLGNVLPKEDIKKLQQSIRAALTSEHPLEQLTAVWQQLKAQIQGVLPDDQIQRLQDAFQSLFDTLSTPEAFDGITGGIRQATTATKEQLDALAKIQSAITIDIPDDQQVKAEQATQFVDGLVESIHTVSKAWTELTTSTPMVATAAAVEKVTQTQSMLTKLADGWKSAFEVFDQAFSPEFVRDMDALNKRVGGIKQPPVPDGQTPPPKTKTEPSPLDTVSDAIHSLLSSTGKGLDGVSAFVDKILSSVSKTPKEPTEPVPQPGPDKTPGILDFIQKLLHPVKNTPEPEPDPRPESISMPGPLDTLFNDTIAPGSALDVLQKLLHPANVDIEPALSFNQQPIKPVIQPVLPMPVTDLANSIDHIGNMLAQQFLQMEVGVKVEHVHTFEFEGLPPGIKEPKVTTETVETRMTRGRLSNRTLPGGARR